MVLCDARADGYSWRELMAAAARACGRTPRLVPVPNALIHAIGITNDFTLLLGQTPMLTSAKARELLHPDWTAPPGDLAENAPAAIYDLEAGFLATMAWYRTAAWVKH